MIRNRRGQSILEYVIVLTVVVAAILVAVVNLGSSGQEGKGVGKLMTKASEKITDETDRLTTDLH